MEDYKTLYEQRLERAKEEIKKCGDDKGRIGMIENIFPELKDSEDEKVRKHLLRHFRNKTKEEWNGMPIKNILAWLKKQGNKLHKEKVDEAMREMEEKARAFSNKHKGESSDEILAQMRGEQNPTDKVEPKFMIGDFIVNEYGFIMQIDGIDGNMYIYHVLDNTGDRLTYDINKTDESCHRWTIRDAKKGDILQADKCTLIFDSLTKDIDGNTVISSWYYCDTKTFYGMGTSKPDLWDTSGVCPATKEQRDFLFQKMKEAGYKWDSEKKELKKIEQEKNVELTDFESALFSAFSDAWQEYLRGEEVNVAKWAKEHSAELLEVAREQKPTWSEEDEKMLNDIIVGLTSMEQLIFTHDVQGKTQIQGRIDWLKSLKERMKGE